MNNFSEAFDQAKSTLSIGVFAGAVEKMQPSRGKLFGADGWPRQKQRNWPSCARH